MRIVPFRRLVLVFVCAPVLAGIPSVCRAQIVESVGSRAMGMGGAFVAVASDSSATWWNPAGLASGPFVDVAVGRATAERREGLPAARDHVTWFAAAMPALGFSHYRLRITDIQRSDPTGQTPASREDTQIGPSLRSLAAATWGVTLVQSVLPGVHVGTTLKYVRGTVRQGRGSLGRSSSDWLDDGDDLSGGTADNRFDMDAGVAAVAGPLRVGAVVRNLRAPRFGGGAVRLPRQGRVGVALDLARGGRPGLVLAVDADARAYATAAGRRQMLAAGAERWFSGQRFALRGGGRVSLAGVRDRVATAGASALIRSGLYVEGHVAGGGADADRGWGIGARATF